MAIRMRIHQNLSSSMTPLVDLTEAMPKFLIVMCIYGIFATVTVLRGTRWVPLCISKNKTLNSGIISVVFFSCFKKFKCFGDVLDFLTPITICHIEVLSFGRFYNLALILI